MIILIEVNIQITEYYGRDINNPAQKLQKNNTFWQKAQQFNWEESAVFKQRQCTNDKDVNRDT